MNMLFFNRRFVTFLLRNVWRPKGAIIQSKKTLKKSNKKTKNERKTKIKTKTKTKMKKKKRQKEKKKKRK